MTKLYKHISIDSDLAHQFWIPGRNASRLIENFIRSYLMYEQDEQQEREEELEKEIQKRSHELAMLREKLIVAKQKKERERKEDLMRKIRFVESLKASGYLDDVGE